MSHTASSPQPGGRPGNRAAPGTAGGDPHDDPDSANKGKILIAWTVVGVPLAYGIIQTLVRASQLFTG